MARTKKNQAQLLPMSVTEAELGNITQKNPGVTTLRDQIVDALRGGMRCYIMAGRLMRKAIDSKYHESVGFKSSRKWIESLPNSAASSYNMMSAASVADYAGVRDEYLSEVGNLCVHHIGRAIKEIEAKNAKEQLVALLGRIRNADNDTAFKAIAEFKRELGLKLTDTDEKHLFGAVPASNPASLVNPEKPEKMTELTVKFRGIAFDDVCKALVHDSVDIASEKAVEKWFANMIGKLAAKIDAAMKEKTAVKSTKHATTATNDEVSPEDAAYIASDEARIAAMNAVN